MRKQLFGTEICGGQGGTAPLSITFSLWGNDQYVVHTFNHQTGGGCDGAYFSKDHWEDAMANFIMRAKRLGVRPDFLSPKEA